MYPPEIENQNILGVNKLEGHAYFLPHSTSHEARNGLEPNRVLLNGRWKFHWVPDAEHRPQHIYREDFNDSKWPTILVPSSQELMGYGTPIYTNFVYPFNADTPPLIRGPVPKDWTSNKEPNPVGSYRRTFHFEKANKRTILCFLGVQSHFFVWVNGTYVGYSQSSFNPAEFDVSKHLKDGKNTIAVQVYKYGAGSWCEDQDMFRLSGIFRDVYLYSMPHLHIWDIQHTPSYSTIEYGEKWHRLEGYVKSKVVVRNDSDVPQQPVLNLQMFKDDKAVAVFQRSYPAVAPHSKTTLECDMAVESPELWSAETPHLYRIVASVSEKCFVAHDFGFRSVEIKKSRLYVNGKAVLLKGVNRHDVSATNGKAVTMSEMEQDIMLMKQSNINTLRTSHYPNHPYLVHLCNVHGLYMIAESNLETHGVWDKLSKDVAWAAMYVDRQQRNLLRDYNNPAIIIWSMGNECGGGDNFFACRDAIKKIDPMRPIHYEGYNDAADIESCMYPSLDWLRDRAGETSNPKPYFICEYSHAMGNAMGNLKEYWELINQDNRLIGGCIWEWQDHGIKKFLPDSEEFFYGYGGDFGDRPNDNNFCLDGIIQSGKEPTAKLRHVKFYYQSIVASYSEGKLRITNNYDFINLNLFTLRYSLLLDGAQQISTVTDLYLEPHQTAEYELKFHTPQLGEYLLNLDFELKSDTSYAKSGHSVAIYQFEVQAPRLSKQIDTTTRISVYNQDTVLEVTNGDLNAKFNKVTGLLQEYRYDNGMVWQSAANALKLNFYRANIDNDHDGTWDWHKLSSAKQILDKFNITRLSEEQLEVKAHFKYRSDIFKANALFTYVVDGDGSITVKVVVTPSKWQEGLHLARIGVQATLAKQIDTAEWYGRGPFESYSDRLEAERVGLHRYKVTELAERYSRPQAAGNHEDCRHVSLFRYDGRGVKVSAVNDHWIKFTALPVSQYAVHAAKHPIDLVEGSTILQIDAVHRGLGNASCGPDTLLEYNVPIEETVLEFKLSKLGVKRGCISM